MATRTDFDARLAAVADRADKAKAEILAQIEQLKNTETSPEQDAILARLEGTVGGLDELNPDATQPEDPAQA